MTPVLIAIILFGGFAFFRARWTRGRRSIVPAGRPERRVETVFEPEAIETGREDIAPAPTMAAAPTEPPGYLLGGRRGGAGDPVAAMMDVMVGPGLCTPRDAPSPPQPTSTKA